MLLAWRLLKWVAGLALALAVLAVLTVVALRTRPLSAEDLALAERLSRPASEATGRNAFAALWALPYSPPEDEIEELLEEDLRRAAAVPEAPGFVLDEDGQAQWAPGRRFQSVLDERFEAVDVRGLPKLCPGDDCLDAIRHDPEAVRAAIRAAPMVVARALALVEHDHLQNPFPNRYVFGPSPVRAFNVLLNAQRTGVVGIALDEGPAAGLAESCRQLAGWRRFARDPGSILQRMLSLSMVRGMAEIGAALAAELPPERALPEACREAWAAPQPADSDLCEVMAAEFRIVQQNGDALRTMAMREWNWLERALAPLFVDARRERAWRARVLGLPCGEPVRQRLTEDRPALDWLPATGIPRTECLAALISCSLADIAAPAYGDYYLRALDHAARLRLLAAARWLHEHTDPALPLAERLAELPDALRGPPERALAVGGDGRSLRIRLYGRGPSSTWVVPMVGSAVSPPVEG